MKKSLLLLAVIATSCSVAAAQGLDRSANADDGCGDGHGDRGRCQRVANL
jgi:hypothetical protein